MKKIIFLLILASPIITHAQIGLKAGLNFANVSKASSINSSSQSGFHAGILISPPTKSVLSSVTEVLFSRQGYNYKTASNTGNVNLDYILLPTFLSINISKYFSIQFGAQMAILLNAKVDSSASAGSGMPAGYGKIMNLYNKFDYGYAVGAEVHPVKGLLIGARYNVSLGKVYKSLQSGEMPSFTSQDAKNNVIQLYTGWRFGGSKKSK